MNLANLIYNGPKNTFDEKLYLHKYPDVAEAVWRGIIPNGKFHYHRYGKEEGRTDSIDAVTDSSLLWKVYTKWAEFHPNIKDFSEFNLLVNKLRNFQSFHLARYNDGEWIFMLQLEPYYSRFIEEHGHDRLEVEEISKQLLAIIDSSPEYYIGIDSMTRAKRGYINSHYKQFQAHSEHLNHLLYGDIFNAATIRHGIWALFRPLKKRYTISVGPSYMSKLGTREHLSVSQNNCWRYSDSIEDQLEEKISSVLHQHPVVLYSCSLLAKLLVDKFFHRYGKNITQLDLGSCIDPWCGTVSRPWHRELMQHYFLK